MAEVCDGPAPVADPEMTGVLSVRDFVECERAARRLAELGSRQVETGRGLLPLAYGYGFTREYGRSRRLEESANEVAGVREVLSFTPLGGHAFLERQGRGAEVVDRPPQWLELPGHRLYEASAGVVARCVVQVLGTGFHVERLPETHLAVPRGGGTAAGPRGGPRPPHPGNGWLPGGREVARMIPAAAGEAEKVVLKDWDIDELVAVTDLAAACARWRGGGGEP